MVGNPIRLSSTEPLLILEFFNALRFSNSTEILANSVPDIAKLKTETKGERNRMERHREKEREELKFH